MVMPINGVFKMVNPNPEMFPNDINKDTNGSQMARSIINEQMYQVMRIRAVIIRNLIELNKIKKG